MYAMKYQKNESMGLHGDYGGTMSKDGIHMSISLGIGFRRMITFSARSIDPMGNNVEDL